MNGNCDICDIEKFCGYEYKPCDCCDYRKFKKREHITDDSQTCWCNPDTTYTDPDTGVSVIIHKEPQ